METKRTVRLGSLLKTHKFVTSISHRPGEVIGFPDFSEGVDVRLEAPDEVKRLHPNILVYMVDAH